MACVKRTPLARSDLKEIGRYLASESQSLDVALRFLDVIARKCKFFSASPLLAEACPDLGDEVRRFPVGNYYYSARLVLVAGGTSAKVTRLGLSDRPGEVLSGDRAWMPPRFVS